MFEGTTTALITPFKEDGSVDYEGLKENVEFQIKNGINNLLPLGTTGETPTLSSEEKIKVVEAVVGQANGRVPVIVGVGTNSTESTIKYAAEAEELGADGLLVVSPYYNKPTQEGLYQHFKSVHDATKLPIVVYNIKGRTGVNIETSTLKRIAELDRVVAVKEASGDINQIMDVLKEVPITVLSGDDGMTYPLMALGGKGVVSVASNLVPDQVCEMVNAALDNDLESARLKHFELLDLFNAIFVETNPVPIKKAMALKGMPAGGVRMPLVEMKEENAEYLKRFL